MGSNGRKTASHTESTASRVFFSYKQNEYSHAATASSPAFPKRLLKNTSPPLPLHLSLKCPSEIRNPLCSAI
jgi:hypothetical protein